jgi:limonene-1,2-epoxide hydrolase
MANANEKIVQDFCAAWRRKNIDELLGFFTADAVYHNMPLEPLQGIAAIRETINMFAAPAESIEFEMRGIASSGDTVFTERVDHFKMMGKTISLPVAGVFEVRNGKIAAWRDYFDMQTYMKQTGMGG